MGTTFSPERLASIRRMRKARRLFRKQPLFAFQMMELEYPKYSYELFLDDLRYRRPPNKRRGKSGLARYGRFRRMEKMVALFESTGEIRYGIQAQQLRRNMTRPYRVRVAVGREYLEHHFSPLIPIERIEELVGKLANCQTKEQAQKTLGDFGDSVSHIN